MSLNLGIWKAIINLVMLETLLRTRGLTRETMIYQLIYASSMRSGMGEKTVQKIAVQSRERNLEHGITGMLLFSKGIVLQVIEGERFDVEALQRQILRDTRHRDVFVVAERETNKREFEDMPMAYKAINSAKGHKLLKQLTKTAESLSMAG